jgi:nitrate/nitrite transport system permease protein
LRQDDPRTRSRVYERQDVRNAEVANGDTDAVRDLILSGKPTITTSLGLDQTVFGFLIAADFSLSISLTAANGRPEPDTDFQTCPRRHKPIVTMIVSAVYTTNDGMLSNPFWYRPLR